MQSKYAASGTRGSDMNKVIIADDEEIVRRGIVLETDWAALDCMVVEECADGESCLEAIRKHNPDILVSDIRMPGYTGIDLVRKIREEGYNTFVIFLTAYGEFEYARSAIQLGATDYILKPFDDGELEAAIRKINEKQNDRMNSASDDIMISLLPEKREGQLSRYVSDTIAYICENVSDNELCLKNIADHLCISVGHLSHVFKDETGCTVNDYITKYRIQKAIKLLKEGRLKVYEVADEVGYKDIRYFSTTFKKYTGSTPSDFC